MGDLTDYAAKEFAPGELVIIAEQLGLAPTARWGARKLVDVICLKIKKSGVPNPPDDEEEMSRPEALLEDFLYVMGYVDDDGNVVESKKGVKYDSVEQCMAANGIEKQPDCYTYADDKDPACRKCPLYIHCAEERIAGLPPCFGLLWSDVHVECAGCLEQPFCKDVVIQKNGTES